MPSRSRSRSSSSDRSGRTRSRAGSRARSRDGSRDGPRLGRPLIGDGKGLDDHYNGESDFLKFEDWNQEWTVNRLFRGYQAYIKVKKNQMAVIAGTSMSLYKQRAMIAVCNRKSPAHDQFFVMEGDGKEGMSALKVKHDRRSRPEDGPFNDQKSVVVGPFDQDKLIALGFEHERKTKKEDRTVLLTSTIREECFKENMHQFKKNGYVDQYWFGVEDGSSGNLEFKDAILTVTLITSYKAPDETEPSPLNVNHF